MGFSSAKEEIRYKLDYNYLITNPKFTLKITIKSGLTQLKSLSPAFQVSY